MTKIISIFDKTMKNNQFVKRKLNVNFYRIKREVKRVKNLFIKIEKSNFNKQKV